jgi:host factor-I protein
MLAGCDARRRSASTADGAIPAFAPGTGFLVGATDNFMKTTTGTPESAKQDALSLQDRFLSDLLEQQIDVTFFLMNGVRLTGKVQAFDRFVVLVRDAVTQMVYKHAISTIVPTVVQASAGADAHAGRRVPEIVKRRPRAIAMG